MVKDRNTALVVLLTTSIVVAGSAVRANTINAAPRWAASSSNAGTTNWPQLGFDPGHSAYNPYETTIGPSNVAHLQQLWSFSAGAGNSTGNVVESDGIVYAPSANGTIFALDASTGSRLWSFASGSGYATSGSAPAFDNGFLFTVCNTGTSTQGICAFNGESGALGWTYTFPGSSAYAGTPPVVSSGMLFFEGCAASCSYVALNEVTGNVVWTQPEVSGCEGNNGVTPAVAYGYLYVGDACAPSGGSLAALNIFKRGRTKWQFTEGGQNVGLTVGSGLVVVEVFLPGNNPEEFANAFPARNPRRGARGWIRYGFSTSSKVFSMAAITRSATFLTIEGGLTAIKTATGHYLWFSYPHDSNSSWPSVANGVVYTACPGTPCAYNASNGALLWSQWSGPRVATYGVPIIVNGAVYGACNGSNVCAWGLPASRSRPRRIL